MSVVPLDVNAKADELRESAHALAKTLGHAVAICRRQNEFFVCDSWAPVEGKVLRLVGCNGQVVRV